MPVLMLKLHNEERVFPERVVRSMSLKVTLVLCLLLNLGLIAKLANNPLKSNNFNDTLSMSRDTLSSVRLCL